MSATMQESELNDDGRSRLANVASVLPPRYRHALYSELTGLDLQIQQCKDWAKAGTPGSWLYITGPSGNGKTHLAAVTAKYYAVHGKTTTPEWSFLWANSAEILYARHDYVNKPGRSDHDYLSRYYRPDLLLLDDLGSERKTDYDILGLYCILNYRWDYMKTTIITGNLSIGQIAGVLDIRIADRILRASTVVTIEAKSHALGGE